MLIVTKVISGNVTSQGDHTFITYARRDEGGEGGDLEICHICRFSCFYTIDLLFIFVDEGGYEVTKLDISVDVINA